MKFSRVVLIGALAFGLAGSATVAANASGSHPTTGAPDTAAPCPGPGPGAQSDTVKVVDGKVFLNGKEIASIPATGKSQVAMKDGKVYVGEEAEALPKPADAHFESAPSESAPSESASGGGLTTHLEDATGQGTHCVKQ
jgi:hypothetical protein